MRRPELNRRQLLTGALVGGAVVAGVAASDAEGAIDLFSDTGTSTANTYAAFASAPPSRLGEHRLLWSAHPSTQQVALTFDDGPTPDFTPRILEILAAHGIRATFDVMGHNVHRFPALLREVAAAGHEIGNHTFNHLNLATTSPERTRIEIVDAQDAIQQVIQRSATLFRPPHGQVTGALLRTVAELDLTTVLWSVDRLVPGVGTSAKVAEAMSSAIGGGDIVCLHDGLGHAGYHPSSPTARQLRQRREVEIAALPDVIARLTDRGLRLGSVGDLQQKATLAAPPK